MKAFLLVTILACFLSLSEGINQLKRIEIIGTTNKLRRKVHAGDMNYMIWSFRLENMADDWAKQCIYEYGWNPEKDKTPWDHIGQLIWAGKVHNYNISKIFQDWFDCPNHPVKTKDKCPSRRQLLHANTEMMACAYTFCPNLINYDSNSFFLTCYFSERDFAHMYAYTPGEPCSRCQRGFDKCRDDLCLISDYKIGNLYN